MHIIFIYYNFHSILLGSQKFYIYTIDVADFPVNIYFFLLERPNLYSISNNTFSKWREGCLVEE
jgi:hypothetical protein